MVGKILENTGNFISNDFNSKTGTKFGTDLAFEILPSDASKGIKSLNVNTFAENILKDATVKAGFTTPSATATLDFDWWLYKILIINEPIRFKPCGFYKNQYLWQRNF